jgi:hypothetical protein
MRVLLATTTGGTAAPIHYISGGEKSPANRITLTHSTAEPKGRGTVVVWFQAADNLDENAFAAWRRKFASAPSAVKFEGPVVDVRVGAPSGQLRIEADVTKGERRILEGGEPDALLSVNGRDVGREILGGLSP